jgi:hypothetical protein
LVSHYEALRDLALAEGARRAGLSAGLLMAKGMAAWMAGWRACTPAVGSPSRVGAHSTPAGEVVGVLAAMALACG